MTLLYFDIGAHPAPPPSRGILLNSYIAQSEPTNTDFGRNEIKASGKARFLADKFVAKMRVGDDSFVQDGEIPASEIPVYSFAIAVCHDVRAKMYAYKLVDYATLATYNGSSAVCADYKADVERCLVTAERLTRKQLGLPRFAWDAASKRRGEEMFKAHCAALVRRHAAWEVNKVRFGCERLRNGYCSPAKPDCPCYKCGKCVEVK